MTPSALRFILVVIISISFKVLNWHPSSEVKKFKADKVWRKTNFYI